MSKIQRGGALAAALTVLILGGALAARAQAPDGNTGVLGQITGAGGDPALGAKLYAERCAGCHDHPEGRTPSKEVISANTPTAITAALFEGVMRPMAAGLTPHDMASLGVYLAKHKGTGLAEVAQAPACKDKPGLIDYAAPQWNGWGRTPAQPRYQPAPLLAAGDVPRLKLKWAFAYPGSRNGQATVVGRRLFVTSTVGGLYALNADTGCAYWRFDVPGGSRSSVTVGRIGGRDAVFFTGWVEKTAYAVDAATGRQIWRTQVDRQAEVQMTGSPVLHDGKLYITVSSAEEAIAADDKYECCKFRGAVVAVDAATGKVLWKTYVAPHEPAPFRKNAKGVQMYGPAGGAIWSAPTIDAKRGVLYVATGDSYTDQPLDTADSILALDLKTGAVRWKNQLTKDDNYIVGGCEMPKGKRANCPETLGPDHDFGASPILHTLKGGRQLILAGQKSSQVYALDPDNRGKVVWEKRLSNGGPLGGVEFGMAADADTLYVAIADIFTRDKGAPGLHAFRIADGTLVWQAIPGRQTCAWKNVFCSPAMSQAVSAMPGVVFGGSMDGRFRAFDARTGKVIWETDTAAEPVATVSGKTARGGVIDGAGPTIANGVVYVTSGYQARSGTPGMVLMAYSVDGK